MGSLPLLLSLSLLLTGALKLIEQEGMQTSHYEAAGRELCSRARLLHVQSQTTDTVHSIPVLLFHLLLFCCCLQCSSTVPSHMKPEHSQ